MSKVVVSAPLAPGVVERLRAEPGLAVDVGRRPTGLGKRALMERLAGATALISLLGDEVDEELLRAAPELRVVANHAVGYDNIDVDACHRRGIVVANTPDVLTDATADFAMALLLAACRRVVEADRYARSGRWPGWSPTDMLGIRVTGATLGLIGCGRIGQAVARRARGFGMRLLYTQPRRLPLAIEDRLDLSFQPLASLLHDSDFVSLHCPLNSETHGLFSRERIALMKRGAVLVNTARGGCVSEEALAAALRAGQLGAAGLDVFAHEPRIAPALLELENVVLAPHIASADLATRTKMGDLCVQAVLDVFAGKEPPNRVLPRLD